MYRILIFLVGLLCYSSLQAQKSDNGFGIFVGSTFTSFHRSDATLVNPFKSAPLIGYEAGINVPVVKGKTYQSRLLLSYFQYGAKERFVNDDQQEFQTELTFSSVKASLLPIYLVFGKKNLKFSIGLGGFGLYNLSNTFSATPTLETNFREDLFEDIIYGGQAMVGLHIKRIVLALNAFNSFNAISESNNFNTINSRGSSITLLYQFGKKERPSESSSN